MFGGDNSSNPMFPVFHGENKFQYDTNALPQLQLFENLTVPVGCGGGPLNYMGNERTTNMDRPTKRGREVDSVSRAQKLQMTLNNKYCQDEPAQAGSILNPNPVSTGLRLSYEEDEHNSSISSVSENMTATLPVILSLGDNLKGEIDRQKEEFDRYIRLQEENIIKGVRELKQRHTASFLSTIEKGVGRRLLEKEHEIESMNRKNKELVERIKQVTMEVHSWHYRAKYNESVVNALKSNLQQVMAQGAMHGKEGCGDSELDDAASCTSSLNQSVIFPLLTSQEMTTTHLTAPSISARSLPTFEGLRSSTVKFFLAGNGLSQRSFRGLAVRAAATVAPKYTSIKPLADRVLVKIKTAEEKTSGGILLPSSAQTKPQGGEVVAVGGGRTVGDTKVGVSVETGAQVVYSKYAGTEVEFNGISHLILKEDDIVGVLETDDIKDLKPLNDRVLIKIAEAEEKTAGGLLLTEASKEKPSIGTVTAVGPGPLDEQGNRKPLTVSTGNTILYSKYAGSDFKGADGSNYIVLRASDVMAILS